MSKKIRPVSMDDLIGIWMDGMCSGAATVAMHVGVPVEQAESHAELIAERLRSDAMGMEGVRSEIRQRLDGYDLGPYTMTVGGAS